MNHTILIIDDDNMLRQALKRGLEKDNFNVLTATSAEQGREIIERITPDAIILDRMMCGIDGLTFLKDIRATGIRIPVIMLTAMTGAENAIDGLTSGADDYLAKPFQLQELILRLNNIIRRNGSDEKRDLPDGLLFTDNEFFVRDSDGAMRALGLSGEEKKLLQYLTTPVGNIAPASPMVAKRLRNKLNIVLSNSDIITIRGRGYKLVIHTPNTEQGKQNL